MTKPRVLLLQRIYRLGLNNSEHGLEGCVIQTLLVQTSDRTNAVTPLLIEMNADLQFLRLVARDSSRANYKETKISLSATLH